ncbi:MAG: leucine-rich repeat domain-containing protein, partial [Clostridia bacterium]|nr:leucine-rich repeat domain-containing protein [Clostridia bacterium]
ETTTPAGNSGNQNNQNGNGNGNENGNGDREEETTLPPKTTPSVGLAYRQKDDGTYCVDGVGTCTDTDILIPATYEGAAVTEIGHGAFYDLADSVTRIAMPDSVTTLSSNAFEQMVALETVTLSNQITNIDDNTFAGCKKLKSIEIPEGVTRIGDSAFYGCESLERVVLPEGVETLSTRAFNNCKSLTSIQLPDSLTWVGIAAFEDSGLTSVTIPKNVETIVPFGTMSAQHGNPFMNCNQLTEIKVDADNAHFSSKDGNLYSKDGKTLYLYAPGRAVGNVTVPEGVTGIGISAFAETRVETVSLPSTLQTIEGYAFGFCPNLREVRLPASVTYVGLRAFQTCESLTTVVIAAGATGLQRDIFRNCAALTNIACGDASKPESWNENWVGDYCNATVTWGSNG